MRNGNAIQRGILALAVTAALGFGAAQAVAAPAERGTAGSCNTCWHTCAEGGTVSPISGQCICCV